MVIRLLYIYIGGHAGRTSVHRKAVGQIKGLRSAGIQADGFFFHELNDDSLVEEGIWLRSIPAYKKQLRFFAPYLKTQFEFGYIADVLEKEHHAYDAIYLRHSGNGPAYQRILEVIGHKTFLFVPSNRIRENYCERLYAERTSLASEVFSWLAYLNFWYQEKRVMRKYFHKVKAIVAFTPEFSRMLQKESRHKVDTIYNRDGVDTASVPARSPIVQHEDVVSLVFLKGSFAEQKWSGLDRLIESIEAHPNLPFKLFITGNATNKRAHYERPFVELTGRLSDEDLERLIDTVDLGVSNLANYLIHFEETTNLKSRDYFSRGLPFIQSNSMPDIDDSEAEDYYLRLPNTSEVIDMQAVYDFAMKMRANAGHAQEMHAFAEQILDWEVTCKELAESISRFIQ